MVSFTDAVKLGYQNYFNFNGRSTIAEFLWWVLFLAAVTLGYAVFSATMGTIIGGRLIPGVSLTLIGLILFYVSSIIPTLSIIIRRLRDTGKSVFWLVLLIIPWGQFVFLYFLLRSSAGSKGSMQTLDEFLAQTSNLNTYEKGLKFEMYCKTLLEALGHHVKHSGQSGDRGIDLRATRDGVVTVIQCKHQQSVAAAVVIQTFGMLHAESADSSTIITTGRFTDDAKKFGSEHPEIELIDRSELSKLVEQTSISAPTTASAVIRERSISEASGYSDRGLTQSNLGEHRRALSDFTNAIELDPEDARYYQLRSRSYSLLGEYDRAISDATKAIELDPDPVYGYTMRASGYIGLGEYDKAISDTTNAIGLDPDSADGYTLRALAYNSLGAFDKAISDATTAIELEPEDARHYHGRGVIYQNVKEHEKATSDLTKAIDLDPENHHHYSVRGEHYARIEKYDKAISDSTKAIELDPQYADDYSTRGSIYDKLGAHEKAISDYTKAIELDPENARYYSSRAASYERLEDYDKAISDATKGIELDSEDADSYSTRGSSYDKLGAHEKAISDYTKALELDPEDDNGKISDRVRQLRDSA